MCFALHQLAQVCHGYTCGSSRCWDLAKWLGDSAYCGPVPSMISIISPTLGSLKYVGIVGRLSRCFPCLEIV